MLIYKFQFHANMPDIYVHIDNEPLNQVNVANYLVLFIDSNLKSKDQINQLKPKF